MIYIQIQMASLLHYTRPTSPTPTPKINLRISGNLGSNSNSNPNSPSSSCCPLNCFGIWKHQQIFRAQAMSTSQSQTQGRLWGASDAPDHLLVLVHGIYAREKPGSPIPGLSIKHSISSVLNYRPNDWRYVESELKRRLGRHFLIYASSSNTYSKTFGGIDGAGKRLADEVKQVVKSKESLKKISFLAHSLGGLIARYAVGALNDITSNSGNGMIAGLEAVNFITLATPHLGVRGNRQLPFLLGVPILEKIAAPMAPIFVGRTGTQLFLTDGNPDKPPLLLRMTRDSDEANFISALGTFKHRILYANAAYDHMVGRRTSSIRRESELVKPPSQSLDGYKHVVDVEYCPPVLSNGSSFPPEAARAKEAAKNEPNTQNTLEYHEIMEEEMIRGLQQLGWKKVDVSFHSSIWPFFAHNNIHVKDEWFHKAGAGVVAHVADSIIQQEKQQQSSSLITANL